jgi:hypothetical protein
MKVDNLPESSVYKFSILNAFFEFESGLTTIQSRE